MNRVARPSQGQSVLSSETRQKIFKEGSQEGWSQLPKALGDLELGKWVCKCVWLCLHLHGYSTFHFASGLIHLFPTPV